MYDASNSVESTQETSQSLMVKSSAADLGEYIAGIVFNAENADDIPTYYFYSDPQYKDAYRHLKQADNVSCSWTTYVCGMGAVTNGVANLKGLSISYPITQSQVSAVKSYCEQRGKVIGQSANHVLTLYECSWYDWNMNGELCNGALNVKERIDNNTFVSYAKTDPGSRFRAIKYMLKHLANNHAPMLVVSSMQNSKKEWIGHYYLVWEIDWKQGGSGSRVLYSDVNKGTSNQTLDQYFEARKEEKWLDLTTFLNLMVNTANNYNIMAFEPKYRY